MPSRTFFAVTVANCFSVQRPFRVTSTSPNCAEASGSILHSRNVSSDKHLSAVLWSCIKNISQHSANIWFCCCILMCRRDGDRESAEKALSRHHYYVVIWCLQLGRSWLLVSYSQQPRPINELVHISLESNCYYVLGLWVTLHLYLSL